MMTLRENWLTEGLIDFEYKKYILLAYLKYVKSNFSDRKLYPYLSDLIFHYGNLQKIRGEKQLIKDRFPKQVVRADLTKLSLIYEQMIEDTEIMKELEDIVEYAMNNIKLRLEEGKHLFEFVEDHLSIEPVGIFPIYNDEGYFMISTGEHQHEVHIYRFALRVYNDASEIYRTIVTEYVDTQKKRLVETFEQIKSALIKRNRELPNPATYVVSSTLPFPMTETLLPVSKRLLIRYLRAA